jgi:membrane fusion protein, heavy metal efflux system
VMNDKFVEIKQGLLPGDEVVVRGGYSLSFAGKGSVSLKEALDAAHGHPHNEDGTEMTKEQLAASGGSAAGGGMAGRHSHWNTLTLFFAATTGILLMLLVALSMSWGKSKA